MIKQEMEKLIKTIHDPMLIARILQFPIIVMVILLILNSLYGIDFQTLLLIYVVVYLGIKYLLEKISHRHVDWEKYDKR